MNVAFDRWIPAVDLSGTLTQVSLCDIFTKGEQFADLSVRPHERVSLMRLFICVAHASLDGPKDYDEWCEVPKRLPESAFKYLTKWRDSFNLFDRKKPWLQIVELSGVQKKTGDPGKVTAVALLDSELATGSNSTLNDHGGQESFREIKPEQIALNLLTFLNFSSGGGLPVAQWKGMKTSQVGNPDAPCLSQSMAHCLFRGKSLAETVKLNIPTIEIVKQVYKSFTKNKKTGVRYSDIPLGRPVWEIFPQSPNSESSEAKNAMETYIGRLIPISRWIRILTASEMYCCNGFKYCTFKEGFAAEPTAAVQVVTRKEKNNVEVQERQVVKVDTARALWRELPALLIKRSAEGLGGPLTMENAPQETEFDFHVCAMVRDQASMEIAVESVFHITPAFQTHFMGYQIEIAGKKNVVIGAEGHARKLFSAVESYRSCIDKDWKERVKRTKDKKNLRYRLAQMALSSYWTAVEKNLPLLMRHIEAIGTDAAMPTLDEWRKMLSDVAKESYGIACGQETPRQIRAYAKGLEKLT